RDRRPARELERVDRRPDAVPVHRDRTGERVRRRRAAARVAGEGAVQTREGRPSRAGGTGAGPGRPSASRTPGTRPGTRDRAGGPATGSPGRRGSAGARGREARGQGASAGPPRRRSAGGPVLVLLLPALTRDAVARERHRVQPSLPDRLPAPLALPEPPLVQLAEGVQDVPEQAPVAVAELEQELAGVGGVRLVAEVLGRVVVGPLLVERAPTDLGLELPSLGDQRVAELAEPLRLEPRRHESPPR